jgi:thiol-disulfide isomerase/thioredoxin
MQKVSLRERLAYRTFLIAQIGVLLIVGTVLSLNGFSIVDGAVLLVLLAASTVFLLMRYTYQTPEIREQEALQQALHNGEKYTLVELFGQMCTGCISIKPTVDKLEEEATERLQVIRLDIEKSPGIHLKRGKRMFTPTFLLYDPHGNLIKETYLVLDRAKILYEVEQGGQRVGVGARTGMLP